jgi:hypothetical protein
MLASILAAIAALPEILKLTQSILAAFKESPRDKLIAIADAFKPLEDAKTDAEYQDAAKAIADAFRGAGK